MIGQRPFRSAVPFYVAGRLNYPLELLDAVAVGLQLDGDGRVLDLGCGPGFLALGFAPRAGQVVAMDPEPAMIAAARDAARRLGVQMEFVLGGSTDLGPHLGRFRLVAMGRSFHWMDREKTLVALDALVEPAGAVALFSDDHPDCPENAWRKAWTELRRRHAPNVPAHARTRRAKNSVGEGDRGGSPGVETHEEVLRRSPFCALEHLTRRYRRQTSVAELIARSLSMSSCSPEALGDARQMFEAELRTVLARYAVDGTIIEIVEAEALLARRPGARPGG